MSNTVNRSLIPAILYLAGNVITPQDAQALISAVENGQMPLKDAIKMVEDIIRSAKP